jgi:DNA-directed RNA polymerase specialized sigma24 family protein
MDTQEEVVRLLAIQIRRTSTSQAEVVREMSRAGFAPKRIAELLGSSPNSVNQVLAEAKRRATKKPED